MLTPLEAIVALWLTAWPSPAGPVPPVVPAAAPSHDTRGSSRADRDSRAALLEATDEELLRRIETDPASLGSLSIGTPGSAILVNPVPLPPDSRWEIARGAITWGTAETMSAIETAIDTVHQLFSDTRPLVIGDISDSDGGRLKRHESHQGGRDVDLGFYYREGRGGWYAPGSSANLDLPRNWALVRALVVRTDVETILLDMRIQRLLYKYALSIAEDKDWLDRVFQCGRGLRGAVVKHLPSHRTHYHVRFFNQVAQELGRRAHPMLVQAGVIEPPIFTIKHVVRRGQTLGHLADRYGVSAGAIQRANGLTASRLRAGRAYRIPVRAAIPASQPVAVPMRPLPPLTPPAMESVAWPTAEALYGDRVAVWHEIAGVLPLAFRRF
ncbi:MAG: LysM peptidoglycan-binding domain-containing protein [Acidobacteria bacterium]|nr:MAG: LysM peptidoglycan-binding domain-containing protein [Acidobacteriota bacterium]